MASIITFDGAQRRYLGDEWSDEAQASSGGIFGDAAYSFVSFGVLAFAVGTGALRAWRAVEGPAKKLLNGAKPRRHRKRRR